MATDRPTATAKAKRPSETRSCGLGSRSPVIAEAMATDQATEATVRGRAIGRF